jgi:pimeloyl-ACP methyl ester carboxylesterase
MRIPRRHPTRESYFFIEPREVSFQLKPPRVSTNSPRHCILLHGWNSSSSYLSELQSALQNLPGAETWHFWRVEYPTHRWTFDRSADEIMRVLETTGHDFSHTVFVGYSMGGIVARRMAVNGFGCKALISICSPHQGLARWIVPHSPGTLSLSRWSRSLRNLNNDARDEALRLRYSFFAITYRDRLGYHPHDGIVTQCSALGKNLGKVAARRTTILNYISKIGGSEPHVRGMNPQYLSPVLTIYEDMLSSDEYK